eukprot:4180448-Pyramimonas_sp.AAC.1
MLRYAIAARCDCREDYPLTASSATILDIQVGGGAAPSGCHHGHRQSPIGPMDTMACEDARPEGS